MNTKGALQQANEVQGCFPRKLARGSLMALTIEFKPWETCVTKYLGVQAT
jgi:hypothetical protein